MRRNQVTEQSKYSDLYIQNKQYKIKSREAIAKSMLQAAEYRRAERSRIDLKLGYYKDGKTFVDGSIVTDLKKKIKEKQDLIKDYEDERKSKDA